jgi:hypothetical protein
MSLNTLSGEAWAMLALNLRSRYPDDWQFRLQAQKDGVDPDLKRWRAIGGESLTDFDARRAVRR